MTTTIAKIRKTGRELVRVHPGGREEILRRRRLRPMTEEQIEAAARSDPDNPPLTESRLKQLKPVPRARTLRRALGLTQEEFAAQFHWPAARG
jgi:putative transcriptional regulator